MPWAIFVGRDGVRGRVEVGWKGMGVKGKAVLRNRDRYKRQEDGRST